MSDQSTIVSSNGENNYTDEDEDEDEENGSFVSTQQMKKKLKAVESRLINPLIN